MRDDPNFSLTAAGLIANWCETLLYGIYLVTCAFAARTLFLKGRGQEERWLYRDEIRWLMVFSGAAIFVLLTFHLAISTYHVYVAFVVLKGPYAALKLFRNLADWVNIARCVTLYITMLLGDFILLYRCWIVYARHRLVLIPSVIIWFAGIAVSIRVIDLELAPETQKNSTLVTNYSVSLWTIAIFILATVQNILSTSLLVHRIWKVDREIQTYTGKRQTSHFRNVVIIVAESGAFFTTSVMLCLITVAVNSNGFYLATNTCMQSSGIVFNVILVRSSASRDQQFVSFDEQSTFRATEGPVTPIGVNDGLARSKTY